MKILINVSITEILISVTLFLLDEDLDLGLYNRNSTR